MATSARSKKTSASASPDRLRSRGASLRAPFAAETLARAQSLAEDYAITVERDADTSGFMGQCVELPGAMGDGPTADACVASVRESIVALVATLLERREVVPQPRSAGKRTEMVNVRVSPTEKARLERAARRSGMSGVSDFIRSAALQAS